VGRVNVEIEVVVVRFKDKFADINESLDENGLTVCGTGSEPGVTVPS